MCRIGNLIAGIWADEQEEHKRDYRHWYHEFESQFGGYSAILADVEPEIESLRDRLQADKRVVSIEAE
jgi:hypothetical protein